MLEYFCVLYTLLDSFYPNLKTFFLATLGILINLRAFIYYTIKLK